MSGCGYDSSSRHSKDGLKDPEVSVRCLQSRGNAHKSCLDLFSVLE